MHGTLVVYDEIESYFNSLNRRLTIFPDINFYIKFSIILLFIMIIILI